MTPAISPSLSTSSLRVLAVILQRADRGLSTSIRDISTALKWRSPTNYVVRCLRRLEATGLIRREKNKSCTIWPACRLVLFREE